MSTTKGIAKVVATGLFVGGIAFAGINYTGGDAVDNITNKSNELQDRFEQATADVTYLQGEFDALNGLYADDMVEANDQISKLISTAVGFREQIRTLQDEIANSSTDNTTAQEEIQAEITRLEQALTEANTDIANLEAEILRIESETQYDPINKESYEAKDLGMPYTADFISLDAYELDYDKAVLFADNAIGMMDAFTNEERPFTINILGVDVAYSNGVGVITYVVDDASIDNIDNIRNFTQRRKKVLDVTVTALNKIGTDNTYFVNEAKSSLIEISPTGDISDIINQ